MSGLVAAPLAHRVASGDSALQIADAIVETWHEIDGALTPIIGKRGLAALYKRSVYITALAHPWLAVTHDGALAVADFVELKGLFQKQTASDALAGATLLFNTFHGLLAGMVGPSLTERLLRFVWADALNGADSKDIKR